MKGSWIRNKKAQATLEYVILISIGAAISFAVYNRVFKKWGEDFIDTFINTVEKNVFDEGSGYRNFPLGRP